MFVQLITQDIEFTNNPTNSSSIEFVKVPSYWKSNSFSGNQQGPKHMQGV